MAHPVFFDQNGRRARIVNILLMLVGADQPVCLEQRPNFHRVRALSLSRPQAIRYPNDLLGTKFDYEQEANDAPDSS